MSKEPDLQLSFLKDEPLPELHVYNIKGRLVFPRPGHRANWGNVGAEAKLALEALDGEIDPEATDEAIARARRGRQPSLFE